MVSPILGFVILFNCHLPSFFSSLSIKHYFKSFNPFFIHRCSAVFNSKFMSIHFNIPSLMTSKLWITSALIRRTVVFCLESWASQPLHLCPGLPAGSALSPVSFKMCTAKLTRIQPAWPGWTFVFTNDILLYWTGWKRHDMIRYLICKKFCWRWLKVAEWCSGVNR